ncbi:MAG: glutathione transferase GstA [Nitrosomonadales bacterium]|nr:glutathione transferase GstA [Nitrosomonadales bacterium]
MKLYYSPGACSLASHIALHETGLPFEVDQIIKTTKMTVGGENFMQVNPKGYVPTIKLDDGSVLTEGVAVLQYIADQKPGSGLAPQCGTMERYHLQEWLTFISSEIHKSFSPFFKKDATEDVKSNARNHLILRLAHVETQLANKPYLMGDRFTVADAYLFVVVGWSRNVGFDLGAFPKIQEYLARIAARPAVQAAMKAAGLLK